MQHQSTENKMNTQYYTTSFVVDQSPEAVFDAINNVRGWWSHAEEGDTNKLGSVFYHHYRDIHRCTLKITELVAAKRVAWKVLHNDFNFIKDKTEWNGTDVIFDIIKKGNMTEMRFTHAGLVPAYECYELCSNAWDKYIAGSLHKLITTGAGEPNPMVEHADHQEEIVAKVRKMSRQLQTNSDSEQK
jgi:hypothetical protein